MNVILLRSAFYLSTLGFCASVSAQEADESALDALDKNVPAKPILQNEAPGARELREAMRRIALSPSDVDALSDAGNAALLLGDGNAALNFYTRANALRPSNGRIKAGLAAATVRTENPFEALRLFDEAVKLGVSERAIAADRAMAFDLLGNFERAQQDYQLARTASTSDELVVQQAISLSLLGRKNDADAMLLPLLKKENPSAWRARAFMLAARGDLRESSKVAQGFLDANSAQRIERYLRQMPQLTGAQQAAAIHLGHFPANNIGRDSEAVRSVAATIPPVANPIGSGRLIPTGNPLGPRKADLKPVKESREAKRDREKAEKDALSAAKLASAKGVSPSSTTPTGKGGLSTDVARARIAEAAKASMAVMTARDLPVPDAARPPVRISLPQPDEPTKVAVALPSITASTLKPVMAAAPASAPLPVLASIPPAQQVSITLTPEAKPVEVKPIEPRPIAAVTGDPVQVRGPGFESLATKGPVEAPASPPPQTPATTPILAQAPIAQAPPVTAPTPSTIAAPVQGPMPNGAVVETPKAQVIFAGGSSDVAQAPVFSPVSSPISTPVETISDAKPPAPFDLGAVVGAIEIPQSEQTPSVTPVDLKKIKPVAPRAVSPEPDPKLTTKSKLAANSPRIWVQIATGQALVVTNDFRSWMKKEPELFKGREGWTSPWSKSARLLVGPFADMKTAKKWEADFRKAGGNGFVWSSGSSDAVDRLKSK